MRNKYVLLHESLFKVAVSFVLVIARYAQSTENSKFVIFFEYLKKEGRDEVDLFDADKHQTFPQVDPIRLSEYGKACPNYKITSLQNLCDISRKKWQMKLNFCTDKPLGFL